jgi:hypothetical protein
VDDRAAAAEVLRQHRVPPALPCADSRHFMARLRQRTRRERPAMQVDARGALTLRVGAWVYCGIRMPAVRQR